MRCKSCGAALELTLGSCPACGAEVELGRLTGILGMVCRSCDAYNEPGARTCAACGKPLGEAAATPPPPAPAATLTPPAAAGQAGPQPPPPAGSPVVRAFSKGGPATRYVPAAALRSPPSEAPALTPVPLGARCPRCGAEAAPGAAFCRQCGQRLAGPGTQVLAHGGPPGRPALAPGRARLVLERGSGADGATFRLATDRVEAGRSRGEVAFPDDPFLAPHHATFIFRGGALHVRDEGAPGGTYLRLRGLSVPLRAGDHFVVGDRLLRYAGPLPPPPPPHPDGTRRLGAPRPSGPALVLEEWLEGGVAGRVFVRPGPSVTIGRAGCAVNLGDDPFLSQAHAEILLEPDGGARLRDLGSSNGTFVRLPPHAERELRDGDGVRIGRQVLRVAAAD